MNTNKYSKRYSLTGMLYCSKCGATLKRRTWNSKLNCKKIVWQCSTYIKEGKNVCAGTAIDDEVISRINIKEKIIVKESIKDGKKHYSYTSKSKQAEHKQLEPQKKKMAAYCRVSTDQLEQLSSYEAQVPYYTAFINNHPDYEMAGIYADEGISGTNTKKREQFNKMIEDCKAGKIDMIITKFISRFARNTLDCLNFVRMLKELGIGVIFEKQNINTLDSNGEVLLSILSSLAHVECVVRIERK